MISIRCFISLTSIEYFILPTTIGVCFALLKLTASLPRLPRFEILLYLSHYFPRNLSSRRMMITRVLRWCLSQMVYFWRDSVVCHSDVQLIERSALLVLLILVFRPWPSSMNQLYPRTFVCELVASWTLDYWLLPVPTPAHPHSEIAFLFRDRNRVWFVC